MYEVKSEVVFESIIKSRPYVVVDFFATWCGPCKAVAPAIEKLEAENDGFVIVKVDVDNEDMVPVIRDHRITSMPTFVFYVHGKKVAEVKGANIVSVIKAIETHFR
jgi:thioredoxin 1